MNEPRKLLPPFDRRWPLCDAVQLACILEATAPKLGNVHPGAHFANMHYCHFATSAIAIRDAFSIASQSVGQVVHTAALATAERVGCNTNLGTILLFGPLAAAYEPNQESPATWQTSVAQVLDRLTPQDSALVYEAIRIAQPGGLGKRDVDDVAAEPPANLVAAMQQVADIDAVARQYTESFADIFDRLLPWLNDELATTHDPLQALCRLQVRWLAYEPDGLITRKLGESMARDIQQRALQVFEQLSRHAGAVLDLPIARELDVFLRADAHRRNPGTTADMIAATLLVRLAQGPTRP